MRPLLVSLPAVLLAASSLLAQDYKLETIASQPPDLPAAYASLIAGNGYRIVGPKGIWCEVWFRTALARADKPKDDAIVLPMAQGALIGVLRFPGSGYDRRGQAVKPGVYTMRYSNYPVDGAHTGVAPQRDFALLQPIASDKDPNALPSYQELVEDSVNGVGTPHPAVISLEPPNGANIPALAKEGESDWVLSVRIGEITMGVILVGKVD